MLYLQLRKAFSHSRMMKIGYDSHSELIFSEISQNSLVVSANCPVMHLCFEHDSLRIIKSAHIITLFGFDSLLLNSKIVLSNVGSI